MEIIIGDLALIDIRDVFQYGIETFGLRKTEEYLARMHMKIEELSKWPDKGHYHPLINKDLRVYNVGKHLIIYKHFEEKSQIIILRIVHQKVNLNVI